MLELKEQPFTVFMLALNGWTVEQLNEQPIHIIEGGIYAIQSEIESILSKATAKDLFYASEVACTICGDIPPNYKQVGSGLKKSSFRERMDQLKRT